MAFAKTSFGGKLYLSYTCKDYHRLEMLTREKIAVIWQLVAGLSHFTTIQNLDRSREDIHSFTKNKRRILEKLIKGIQGTASPKTNMIKVLREYHEYFEGRLESQTPLSLFVGDTLLFYEVFWSYARRRAKRQCFILTFKSPIDFSLTHEFELEVGKEIEEHEILYNMIYIGCLTERVPVLQTAIEGKRETIIPSEVLCERIHSFLSVQKDFTFLKEALGISDDDIKELIRVIISDGKPVFLEFITKEYSRKKEDMIIVSLKGEASLKFKRHTLQATSTANISMTSRILRKISGFFRCQILSLPFDEPTIATEIFPKSPQTTCWVYIFAPPRYNLKVEKIVMESDEVKFTEEEAVYENKGNTLENNAPKNPRLISLRLSRDQNANMKSLGLNLKVRVPATHKYWLNGLDKVLLTFLAVWLLADAHFVTTLGKDSLLPLVLPFMAFFGQRASSFLSSLFSFFHHVVNVDGFLEVTFTLVSFVFLARSWFFHESSIFRKVSIRFLVVLVLISFSALLYVLLSNI
ncbi:MAG: hypothetical protein OEZ35_06540 [Candidatus Bathyarchaeota archaeon]|nr:hypothetical protein [Candidatus Bathyarchaeota archaeon]